MKTKELLLFIAWSICTLFVVDIGFSLISESDTLLNVLGVVLIALYGVVSCKIVCFTNIKVKK